MKYPIRWFWIALGTLAMILGALGVILPFLPTVPFLLLTLCCYGRSSERLERWFLSSSFYKNNLKSYVEKRGMTMKTKLSIISMVTVMMLAGFFMMKAHPAARIVLAAIWLLHVIYFFAGIKTLREIERKRQDD